MNKPKRPDFKNKTFHQSRKFLNKKEGFAAIQTHVSVEYTEVTASIDISDCSRKISLDFWSWKEKDYKPKLEKIDLLISELTSFRDSFVEATALASQREAIYQEYSKQYKKYEKSLPNNPEFEGLLSD